MARDEKDQVEADEEQIRQLQHELAMDKRLFNNKK